MPVFAVSLALLFGVWTFTAKHVYRAGNWFEMVWRPASWIAAQMIQFKTFRNWSSKQLIGNPVSVIHDAEDTHLTVAVLCSYAAKPDATTISRPNGSRHQLVENLQQIGRVRVGKPGWDELPIGFVPSIHFFCGSISVSQNFKAVSANA
jgi:hypothetical protein